MYRRPKFLEILHEIREEMSREADYDMDLFAELARSGQTKKGKSKNKFRLPDSKSELWNVELTDTEH
ncbi:MAG: hypothetical protein ACR2GD_05570 [Pyrinomonadaceae bacterium]